MPNHNNYINMTQYTPSFVDVTGFTDAIAQGLKEIAKENQRKEELAQKQLEDFRKYYDTDALRIHDLPLFINQFEDFKKASLTFSRLNKGGGNAEEIAVASKLREKALADLSDTYEKSVSAKQLLKEREAYRVNMFNKNYQPAPEVNTEIDELSTLPVDKIDLKKYTSPYSREVFANSDDVKFLDNTIKSYAKINEDYAEDETKSKEFNIEGVGKVKIPYKVKVTGYNTKYLLDRASLATKARPRLLNEANKKYKEISEALSIPETEVDPQLASIRQLALDKYNSIMENADGNSFSPELILLNDGGYLQKTKKDIGLDKDSFLRWEKEASNKLGRQKFELARRSLGLQAEKFGYLKDKDMQNMFFKAGAENIPSVQKAAEKKGVDIQKIQKSRIEEAKAKKAKTGKGLSNPFSSGFKNPQ